MNSPAIRHPAGFTLVETLVAGVVLAISVLALGTTISLATRSLARARDYQQAAELLDRTLTKIDIIGPYRLSYEGPLEDSFPVPHERFSWKAEIESRSEGNLYEVTVHIFWTSPAGQQRSVQAQTLLNDAPGSRLAALDWYSL